MRKSLADFTDEELVLSGQMLPVDAPAIIEELGRRIQELRIQLSQEQATNARQLIENAIALDETKAQKNRAVLQASNADDIVRQLRARLVELEARYLEKYAK